MKQEERYRPYNQYYRPGIAQDSRSSSQKTHKKGRNTILILVVLIALSVFIKTSNSGVPRDVKSTVTTEIHKITANLPQPTESKPDPSITVMGQTINGIIAANSDIDVSVNTVDLDNNQAEHYGDTDEYQAASTAKILAAEYFLHEVENGQQSLNQTINGETAQQAIQQMIVVSDDPSWKAIETTVGYDNLQSYIDKTFNISDYQAYNNSLSSTDIALALQGLWEGKVLNKSDTQMLLTYMKEANYRQFIVPAVPGDDTIYHKIGFYQDYLNDAAIITHDNQAFALVIFTNGNGEYNWPARASMMQEITKAALKAYFNQS